MRTAEQDDHPASVHVAGPEVFGGQVVPQLMLEDKGNYIPNLLGYWHKTCRAGDLLFSSEFLISTV